MNIDNADKKSTAPGAKRRGGMKQIVAVTVCEHTHKAASYNGFMAMKKARDILTRVDKGLSVYRHVLHLRERIYKLPGGGDFTACIKAFNAVLDVLIEKDHVDEEYRLGEWGQWKIFLSFSNTVGYDELLRTEKREAEERARDKEAHYREQAARAARA